MNLSKTSQYALKIMNYMAVNDGDNFTSHNLHEKLKIPHQYLRRLLTKLSNNGLIKGGKGRKGGYVFAKSIKKIFLSDILEATGESEIFNSCIFGFEDCLLFEECKIHNKWAKARENILEILSTTNLGHLKSKKAKSNKKHIKKFKNQK